MGWLVNSAFQSVVVFVMVMAALTPLYADRHSGRTAGQWQTGATLFTAVVMTVHLEISSVIDHWTWLHAFAVLFSVCKSPLWSDTTATWLWSLPELTQTWQNCWCIQHAQVVGVWSCHHCPNSLWQVLVGGQAVIISSYCQHNFDAVEDK